MLRSYGAIEFWVGLGSVGRAMREAHHTTLFSPQKRLLAVSTARRRYKATKPKD